VQQEDQERGRILPPPPAGGAQPAVFSASTSAISSTCGKDLFIPPVGSWQFYKEYSKPCKIIAVSWGTNKKSGIPLIDLLVIDLTSKKNNVYNQNNVTLKDVWPSGTKDRESFITKAKTIFDEYQVNMLAKIKNKKGPTSSGFSSGTQISNNNVGAATKSTSKVSNTTTTAVPPHTAGASTTKPKSKPKSAATKRPVLSANSSDSDSEVDVDESTDNQENVHPNDLLGPTTTKKDKLPAKLVPPTQEEIAYRTAVLLEEENARHEDDEAFLAQQRKEHELRAIQQQNAKQALATQQSRIDATNTRMNESALPSQNSSILSLRGPDSSLMRTHASSAGSLKTHVSLYPRSESLSLTSRLAHVGVGIECRTDQFTSASSISNTSFIAKSDITGLKRRLSASQFADEGLIRILNPKGQACPTLCLNDDDLFIDPALEKRLLERTPRMAGHIGKRATPSQLHAWTVSNWSQEPKLVSVERHVTLFTNLVYSQGSAVGYFGRTVEKTHYATIKRLCTDGECEWPFKSLLSPKLCQLFTADADEASLNDPTSEWKNKWGDLIFSTTNTLKSRLNSVDGEKYVYCIC
jgi:hypothetical protein